VIVELETDHMNVAVLMNPAAVPTFL